MKIKDIYKYYSMNMFETNREIIHINNVSISDVNLPHSSHVFALCITRDNIPIIGIRRTSFIYQNIIAQRKKFKDLIPIDLNLLQYLYPHEIKEIYARVVNPMETKNILPFEELVLLGGKRHNNETMYQCLNRELSEESDNIITIKEFGEKAIKILIEDKIIAKKFSGYCIACLIYQTYTDVKKPLYNIEISKIVSLFDKSDNEKYEYLNVIYNSILPLRHGDRS